MLIKNLKEWLSQLPVEFDEFHLVFRTVKPNDQDTYLAQDDEIVACGIDTEHNEAYFCDQESYLNLKNYEDYDEEPKEDDDSE